MPEQKQKRNKVETWADALGTIGQSLQQEQQRKQMVPKTVVPPLGLSSKNTVAYMNAMGQQEANRAFAAQQYANMLNQQAQREREWEAQQEQAAQEEQWRQREWTAQQDQARQANQLEQQKLQISQQRADAYQSAVNQPPTPSYRTMSGIGPTGQEVRQLVRIDPQTGQAEPVYSLPQPEPQMTAPSPSLREVTLPDGSRGYAYIQMDPATGQPIVTPVQGAAPVASSNAQPTTPEEWTKQYNRLWEMADQITENPGKGEELDDLVDRLYDTALQAGFSRKLIASVFQAHPGTNTWMQKVMKSAEQSLGQPAGSQGQAQGQPARRFSLQGDSFVEQGAAKGSSKTRDPKQTAPKTGAGTGRGEFARRLAPWLSPSRWPDALEKAAEQAVGPWLDQMAPPPLPMLPNTTAPATPYIDPQFRRFNPNLGFGQ